MAIAFDVSSNGGSLSAVSPKTWSHTCTGSDRFLFVTVNATAAAAVTGVTYNSVAMTQIQSEQVVSGAYNMTLWYLANPASGSNTVSISFSSGSVNGAASSYTGVLGGINASAKGTDNSTPITGTVTTTVNNCWLIMTETSDGANPSAGTDTTLREQWQGGTGLFDSNAARSTGSNSLEAVSTGTSNGGFIVAAFSPTVAVSTNNLLLAGD